MKTLYEKVMSSDIPETLNKIIYDVDRYSKKIKKEDNQSIKAIAETNCDLLILQDKMKNNFTFKPIDFITAVNEAADSIIMVDFDFHGGFAEKMRIRLHKLLQAYSSLIQEEKEAENVKK